MSNMSTENPTEENENNTNKENKEEIKYDLNLSLAPYILLAIIRIVLTVLPQTGYIQPDEFFQSVEIVNEDIFNVEAKRPWEFNTTKPIRSVTLPYLYAGIPNYALKYIAPFLKFWFNKDILTPYYLIVIPRLVVCLLSFVNDWSLYKICVIYGQNFRARLLTLASSYVLIIYGTHTFSNSIEMSLTSILIYYVAESMYKSDQVISQDEYLAECYSKADNMRDKIKLNRLRKSLPGHSFSSCIIIASVTVIGFFNRPTFLAFAFSPIFFWLHRGLGSKHIGLSEFHLRIVLLGLCALPMTVFLILIDSFYFGYLTWSEIIQNTISLEKNFVVTPYNFIQYNAYTDNLANHGLHPRVTHALLNVPLLYNVLGLAAMYAVANLLYRFVSYRWGQLPRIQSIIGLMTSAYIIPIALLSIFPHQEPRFLIPVTLPLVFLHAQRIRNVNEHQCVQEKQQKGGKIFFKKETPHSYKDKVLTIWYLVNIVMVVIYGYVHQAGVYPLIDQCSSLVKDKPHLTTIHLVTSYLYPLPISLLLLKHSRKVMINEKTGIRYQHARDFLTYEMGLSESIENATIKIKDIQEKSERTWQEKRLKYKIIYAIPTSRLTEFEITALKMNISYAVDQIFYPHISTEVMPDFSFKSFSKWQESPEADCEANINKLSLQFVFQYISHIFHQCGLAFIKINI